MNLVNRILAWWVDLNKPENPFEKYSLVTFDNETSVNYAKWYVKRVVDYLRIKLGLHYANYPRLYSPKYWSNEVKLSLIDECYAPSRSVNYTEEMFINEVIYCISRLYASIDQNGEYEFIPHNKLFQYIYNTLAPVFKAKERKFIKDFEIIDEIVLTKEIVDEYRDSLNTRYNIEVDDYITLEFNNFLEDGQFITNWLFLNLDNRKLFDKVAVKSLLDASGLYLSIDVRDLSELLNIIYSKIGTKMEIIL